ncbi:PREDICTED: methionyl-tRNA formyltransferase, mitochondrial [Papilio xuthus]|uniref:Methionyl-tRNA formyltransferase, mitochondrial n=1 Tax=Papilio xuthus TaxID=66420 RepID=A0AAJ6Z3E2_PAPXU|nr:PREDICTED: methionyl-tRNA formyltransferase, mitochondrial [Papilio xuthus]
MTCRVYNLSHILFKFIIRENIRNIRYFSNKKSYNVLFFGSDNIALGSLKRVNEFRKEESKIDRLSLVTANTSLNKSAIEKYAHTENINTLQWPLQRLHIGEYDIGLIVAFGHLIKDDLLKKFPLGMVNVHPSLLPRWRGAAPIIYTLLHGDQITGVTLMKIKPNIFDVGEIISQEEVAVSNDIKLPELTEQLSTIGAEMLVDCLRHLPHSLENAQPQSNEGVTYAKKINKSICEVKWSEMSAIQVYNLYRAIYGLYSLKTKFRDKEMKLFNAFLDDNNEVEPNSPPGTLQYCERTKSLRILCRDRRYINFKSIRIVGKKEITALDFFNGYIKNVSLNKENLMVC